MDVKLIVSVICFSFLKHGVDGQCSSNEVYEQCKNPYEATCQRPNPPPFNSRYPCKPGCSCKPGNIRDDTSGRCIPQSYCQRGGNGCQEGEIPCDDTPKCEPTCQTNGRFPGFQCVSSTKTCICKAGLVRDPSSGNCVPLNCCKRECGRNEVWSDCANPNCRPTCQNPTKSQFCPCEPGCVCKEGYIWDEECRQCVPQDECPQKCGENEIWKQCSDLYCRKTCKNKDANINCPRCKPGCSCKDGYVWDVTCNKCILPKDCPPECGENQEWRQCSDRKCRETCQRPKPKLCNTTCEPGCSCEPGYVWDEICDKCVTRDQCSKACKKNEEWCEYLPDEIPTCQTLRKPQCRRCNVEEPILEHAQAGCLCIEGYIYDENTAVCVPIEDCFKRSRTTEAPSHSTLLLSTTSSTRESSTEVSTTKGTTSVSSHLSTTGSTKSGSSLPSTASSHHISESTASSHVTSASTGTGTKDATTKSKDPSASTTATSGGSAASKGTVTGPHTAVTTSANGVTTKHTSHAGTATTSAHTSAHPSAQTSAHTSAQTSAQTSAHTTVKHP